MTIFMTKYFRKKILKYILTTIEFQWFIWNPTNVWWSN